MSHSQQQPGYKNTIIDFWGFVWKVFLAIATLVTLGGAISDFRIPKSHPYWTALFVFALTVFVSLLLLIRKLINEGLTDKRPLVLSTELVKIVTTLYGEKKHLDVVRFGSTVSRYLWLNGHNHERIQIGKMVEDAASKVGRTSEQVSCLIDDIGWTYEIVGDTERAITNISSGIEKAVENQLFYLAAKGERHLSGIEKHRGNSEQVSLHLNNARTYCTKILDSSDRSEIEASIFLAEAKFLFETQQLEEAEKLAKKAIAVFERDPDRIVKVHSLLGNIYLKQGKRQKAKDEFNRGYKNSEFIRKDEVAKNARGLADVALAENDITTCVKYLTEAKEIYGSLHKNKEVREIENLLKPIQGS
jgi:tetratricopeptide (TPR) repeat protein